MTSFLTFETTFSSFFIFVGPSFFVGHSHYGLWFILPRICNEMTLFSALTGLNKAETAEKHGEEQVQIWRRSYDVPPPPMEKDHPYYDIIVKDER